MGRDVRQMARDTRPTSVKEATTSYTRAKSYARFRVLVRGADFLLMIHVRTDDGNPASQQLQEAGDLIIQRAS